jgi:hypothetical protein
MSTPTLVGHRNEIGRKRVRNETRDTHLVGGVLGWTSVRLTRTTRIWCGRLAVGVLRSGGICGALASIEAASAIESPVILLVQVQAGHRRGRARRRASPPIAEPGRLLSVHGRDWALDAGGGLRVGVGVERLRVAVSVGALFGIGIVVCVAIVRTATLVVGALHPIPGLCVTHTLRNKNNVSGQAVVRREAIASYLVVR